jgi:hypothetical protein
MSLKGFHAITFLAIGMGLTVSCIAMQQALFMAAQTVPAPVDSSLVAVSLAFMAIGGVAAMARAALKKQAERIAELERRIAGISR